MSKISAASFYPAKYRDLIDAETWAFIDRTRQWYPANAVDHSIEWQRETYDRLCLAFSVGYPQGVDVWDFEIPAVDHSIACLHYRPTGTAATAMILYFHGGGYVVGGLHSHDDYCAEICKATGFELFALDYRLAPEHEFPADRDDALVGYCYLTQSSDQPILLLGDSAGGNIAATVAHAARSENRQPAGQVLVYPQLGNNWSMGSFAEHANAPMLSAEDVIYYAKMRCGGDLSFWSDKTASPLCDPDLTGLPPTIVFAAQFDPLRDDGQHYCDAIRAKNGQALFVEEAGLVHSYLLARHSVGRAKTAVCHVVDGLLRLGNGRGLFEFAP